MIPVKVAISGQPGTGKTETVLKIAELVSDRYTIGGFTTHVRDEDGEMVELTLRDYSTGEEELAASVRWEV